MNTMKFLTIAVIVLAASVTANAQAVSADSMQSLKQQKQSIELSGKINEKKMQLAKLENKVEKKTMDMQSTAAEAQKAANDNADAASRLSADAQNRQLAKKAEKAGNYAKKCAARARSAADDLDGLKKDIESLRGKIAEDESKLAANPVTNPLPTVQQ